MSSGILLSGDGGLYMSADEIAENLRAGIIAPCESDTIDEESPACGHQHSGSGFFHLTAGHSDDDVL